MLTSPENVEIGNSVHTMGLFIYFCWFPQKVFPLRTVVHLGVSLLDVPYASLRAENKASAPVILFERLHFCIGHHATRNAETKWSCGSIRPARGHGCDANSMATKLVMSGHQSAIFFLEMWVSKKPLMTQAFAPEYHCKNTSPLRLGVDTSPKA